MSNAIPIRRNGIRGARTGTVCKYDDLPRQYHGNVDTEPPFHRHPGDAPALSDDEIDAVIALFAEFDRWVSIPGVALTAVEESD
jgi:hypothetical protein